MHMHIYAEKGVKMYAKINSCYMQDSGIGAF